MIYMTVLSDYVNINIFSVASQINHASGSGYMRNFQPFSTMPRPTFDRFSTAFLIQPYKPLTIFLTAFLAASLFYLVHHSKKSLDIDMRVP
jgi:hypothetical protein